jgi:hypothetical protein
MDISFSSPKQSWPDGIYRSVNPILSFMDKSFSSPKQSWPVDIDQNVTSFFFGFKEGLKIPPMLATTFGSGPRLPTFGRAPNTLSRAAF